MTLALAKRTGAIRPARRSFTGAQASNLTASWTAQPSHVNSDLQMGLRTLRARSRDLANNSDYGRKFLSMVETNVVGHAGFSLQVKPLRPDGTVDELDAARLESGFRQWSRPGVCDVTGQYSLTQIERLFIRTVARDGEVGVRYFTRGPHGFQIQLVDPEQLDEGFNGTNGENKIRMGVEYSAEGAIVAYHLTDWDTADPRGSVNGRKRIRVPSTELRFYFLPEMIGQLRGTPWMASAMYRLGMLNGYEEAEVTAARIASAKMGFFIDGQNGEQYLGDGQDEQGNIVSEPEPGSFERLPFGVDFKPFDPQHPNAAYKDFVKSCLRGISSGLGVSYVTLANDLEGVNYSSIRAGVLEEREVWKALQVWMIDQFLLPLYAAWLKGALTTGTLGLPPSKIDKFNAARWTGRRWDWVDPLKDMEASILAIKHGLKSRTEIANEQGRDLNDVWSDLAREQADAEAQGVKLLDLEPTVSPAPIAAP